MLVIMTSMIASALLLAVATAQLPATPASHRPTRTVSARATASIRIISGASFGAGRTSDVPGARRRATRLIEGEGQVFAAELLEFQ